MVRHVVQPCDRGATNVSNGTLVVFVYVHNRPTVTFTCHTIPR
jgi:hypothetical protein